MIPPHPTPRVITVVGPTAAGKSDLGVFLAQRLGGEVINADSMQLYRGMDIGTAKLTLPERDGVPHHLLDIWDVTEAASVAEYQRLARREIDRLLAEGRTPILVGGSGLYVKGAIDALEFPGTDPEVRARLEAELAEGGSGFLHARLAAADPEAARSILASNGRRIVRALEVIEITGKPFTANLPGDEPVYDALQIGVDVERPELDERIALRVDRMWEAGLVDEVRALETSGLREGLTASRALGYQQILAALAGSAPRRRRGPRPCAPPSASPAVRIRGSAATRVSCGSEAETMTGGTPAPGTDVGRTSGHSLIT